VGALLGVVLAVYVARVGRKIGLFVFAVLFVVAEAGGVVHLDPLLAGLAAGLFLENVSDVGGDRVAREIEPVSLPTFAVFFGVVGAEIHVHDFLQVAPWALACAAVRAAGLSVGAVTTGRRMRLDPDLVRRIPYGLLPQAGVAIALALLVKQKFPPFGEGLSTLILGTIVVNELVGPVLWRAALVGAGEVGARREGAEAGHARRAATATPVPTTIDPTAG
jgi:Kef-type K+ transport system membrane component KefB